MTTIQEELVEADAFLLEAVDPSEDPVGFRPLHKEANIQLQLRLTCAIVLELRRIRLELASGPPGP